LRATAPALAPDGVEQDRAPIWSFAHHYTVFPKIVMKYEISKNPRIAGNMTDRLMPAG
jgi:hypothetical protein